MSDQSSSAAASLKHFLTEEQIEIERQRRQADWERVRSSNDPVGKDYFFYLVDLYLFELYRSTT